MKPYKIIEHTADIGIEVSGPSLNELFVNAAIGLVELMVECSSETQLLSKEIELELEASIKEELLVRWLEELLYLFEVNKLVPIEFNIVQITDKDLKARVVVTKYFSEIHVPKYQIKAVTYHNLNIDKEGDKFRTRIIFDI